MDLLHKTTDLQLSLQPSYQVRIMVKVLHAHRRLPLLISYITGPPQRSQPAPSGLYGAPDNGYNYGGKQNDDYDVSSLTSFSNPNLNSFFLERRRQIRIRVQRER